MPSMEKNYPRGSTEINGYSVIDLLSDKDLNIEILIYLLCGKMTLYPSNHLTGRHYNYAFRWLPIFPSVPFVRDYKSSDSQTGLPLQQHICSNQCMCSDWFFLDHFFKLHFFFAFMHCYGDDRWQCIC